VLHVFRFLVDMLSGLGGWGSRVWSPPVLEFAAMQVRFKRSKKRKMAHRVINEVQRETMGLPPGPSLGSVVGNPQSPYEITKNIKQHLERLSAMDTTHIRRKKDYGRYNFHRVLRAAGLSHESQSKINPDEFVTSLTQLQDRAELPSTHDHNRFNFPHVLQYKAYWGPPTVEKGPNRYAGSMVGVNVSFCVDDLMLKEEETQTVIEIVGSSRFDPETRVVSLTADIFPDRNHNAAFLGDVVQQLIKVAVSND
jgi:small subunit ribosomal protein S35